jgi:hypothetical protein
VTFPFGQDVVLLLRTSTGVDEFGDDTASVVERTVRGAYSPGGVVGGGGRAGAESETTGVVLQPTVYLPADATDLNRLDGVRVDGVTYEVDGQPIRWNNPFTGAKPGIEVRLAAREM